MLLPRPRRSWRPIDSRDASRHRAQLLQRFNSVLNPPPGVPPFLRRGAGHVAVDSDHEGLFHESGVQGALVASTSGRALRIPNLHLLCAQPGGHEVDDVDALGRVSEGALLGLDGPHGDAERGGERLARMPSLTTGANVGLRGKRQRRSCRSPEAPLAAPPGGGHPPLMDIWRSDDGAPSCDMQAELAPVVRRVAIDESRSFTLLALQIMESMGSELSGKADQIVAVERMHASKRAGEAARNEKRVGQRSDTVSRGTGTAADGIGQCRDSGASRGLSHEQSREASPEAAPSRADGLFTAFDQRLTGLSLAQLAQAGQRGEDDEGLVRLGKAACGDVARQGGGQGDCTAVGRARQRRLAGRLHVVPARACHDFYAQAQLEFTRRKVHQERRELARQLQDLSWQAQLQAFPRPSGASVNDAVSIQSACRPKTQPVAGRLCAGSVPLQALGSSRKGIHSESEARFLRRRSTASASAHRSALRRSRTLRGLSGRRHAELLSAAAVAPPVVNTAADWDAQTFEERTREGCARSAAAAEAARLRSAERRQPADALADAIAMRAVWRRDGIGYADMREDEFMAAAAEVSQFARLTAAVHRLHATDHYRDLTAPARYDYGATHQLEWPVANVRTDPAAGGEGPQVVVREAAAAWGELPIPAQQTLLQGLDPLRSSSRAARRHPRGQLRPPRMEAPLSSLRPPSGLLASDRNGSLAANGGGLRRARAGKPLNYSVVNLRRFAWRQQAAAECHDD